MSFVHSEVYRVASYQCNKERNLKLESVLNFTQDALESFGQNCGMGVDVCREKKLAWVIRNNDVAICNLPTWSDKIIVDTQIQLVHRSILVVSSDAYALDRKKRLFSSTSHLVLIDLLSQRPSIVKDKLPHLLDLTQESGEKPVFVPIPSLTRLDSELNKPVRWDYIDFNQHVNNAAYVVFARQTLPTSFYERNRLTRVRAAYKASATLGDTMLIQTQKEDIQTLHKIVSKSNPSTEFARVQMDWRVRE